jgi:hypothetical protein
VPQRAGLAGRGAITAAGATGLMTADGATEAQGTLARTLATSTRPR